MNNKCEEKKPGSMQCCRRRALGVCVRGGRGEPTLGVCVRGGRGEPVLGNGVRGSDEPALGDGVHSGYGEHA